METLKSPRPNLNSWLGEERRLLPSPRGEFLSEASCTYAAARIDFLLGLVQ